MRTAAIGAALVGAMVLPVEMAAQPLQEVGGDEPVTEVPLEIENVEGGPAIAFSTAYTADVWRNEGGASNGWVYLDNIDIIVAANLERAAGLTGTTAAFHLLYNNDNSLTRLVGDVQAVSNIETGVEAIRVLEAWVQQELGDNASLLVGLYDLNSEFDALATSDLFIGSAHGIGTDISQSGENGPSIFPATSLSARFAVDLTEQLTVRVAALDAIPGNPGRPKRTSISLNDGALLIAEADWSDGGTRILAGAWGYTERQDRIDGLGQAHSGGVYLRGEQCLVDPQDCGLAVFARTGVARKQLNPFEMFVSAGAVVYPNDNLTIGLAVAHAIASDKAIASQAVFGSETVIEGTAAFAATDWLTLQPNVQYIIDPAAIASQRDAVAFGLRFVIEP